MKKRMQYFGGVFVLVMAISLVVFGSAGRDMEH